MRKFHGKYLVAAAVFSLVATFTSAAGAIGDTCNNNGECTVVGAICNTKCVCGGSYKEDPGNNAQCIKKALGDDCAAGTDSDCDGVTNAVCKPTEDECACVGKYKQDGAACVQKGLGDACDQTTDCSGVANSECSGTPTTCVCKAEFTPTNGECLKGLGDSCTGPGDCSAVTGATCGNSNTCACGGSYKPDTADNTKCKLKGLADSCSAPGDCSAVTGATCGTSNTCVCGGSYTLDTSDLTKCKLKGLDDTCDQTTDCSGVTNSECSGTSNTCVCKTGFRPSNGQCIKGLGDSCTGPGDCSAVTGATCGNSNTCACGGSYKPDTADNTKCKLKGLGDTCAIDADCSAGVTNSKCSAGTPTICECIPNYTEIDSLCKKGLNNTCNSDPDCSAVANAECDGTSKRCVCKITYKEDNGKCSSANGLQTPLSVPVAFLISLLTIVFTRLP